MPKLEEGWLTVVLLCAMMVVAAGGVAAAAWTEHLHAAWVTAVVGVLAGLALARSRFSGNTAFLFSVVYGIFTVGFFIGLGLEGSWHERSVEILRRLNDFLYKAIYGGTSRDPLPFPVTVSLIFWFVGVLAAWSVFRRGAVWPAIIPAGVGLLVNAYYYLGPARLDLYMALYVLLALLFVARMNLLAREREWQSARVSYSSDLRIDFLRAGLAAALAGVLIAWAAPSLAASPQAATTWRRVAGQFSFVREGWLRMFAAIRGYGQAYSDFYGDTLVLGGPARLSTEPIMDVTVNAVSDEAQDDLAVSEIPRYYWRAEAYTVYENGAWAQGDVEFREFDPNRSRLTAIPYAQRRQVSLTFTMHVPATSRLYAAPQVQWVDRPSTVVVTLDRRSGPHDVTSMRASQVVRRGETYQVVSSISVADAQSLRTAGTRYPDWVLNQFLQLPPEITDRTRELAEQIVAEAGAANPYDQAQAITQWLRDNIEYDQNIDAPPPDTEPVDYLLFELRRGYCFYYATAEVVMLRSLGIPARMGVGMAQGTLDPQTNTYHVLEQNAHAWPEVFFPGYGWVEFEPTVSEAPLVRPERQASSESENVDPLADFERGPSGELFLPDDFAVGPDDTASQAPPLTTRSWLERLPWVPMLASAGGLLVLALAVALASFRMGVIGWESLGRLGRWVMHKRGQLLPSTVGLIYLQLERVAQWLGLGRGGAVTPFERAEALAGCLPETRPGVEAITREYVAEQYSPRPPNVQAAQQAWRGIRVKLWHDAIRQFLLDVLEEEPPPRRVPRL